MGTRSDQSEGDGCNSGIAKMIFNPAAGIVIDSLGWVDKGALWAFDIASQTENLIASDLAGASIRTGEGGFFRVWHPKCADSMVSIRHVGAPGIERAAVRFRGAKPEFSGDVELWRFVETAVLMFAPPHHEKLIKIDPIGRRVVELDPSWYLRGGYDLVYQGLIDCLTLPDENRVIVSVQRSSKLVVIDIEENRPVGSIELADRGGNPNL
ncbi:MAG TPA: hypothetical protein VKT70_15400, partial [Stellaceae bacterium]|nr:hypothetical protein [Stellaceae bacterium]